MIGRMTLKLERTKLAVDAYGEMIELTKPSLFEVMEIEEKITAANKDSKEISKIMIGFLKSAGMPDKLLHSMEMGHVLVVCEAIMGKKKDSPTEV